MRMLADVRADDRGLLAEDPSRYRPRVLRYGWLPAGLTALFAVALLRVYSVSLTDMAAFALYVVIVVALPGMLIWRLLRGKAGPIALDIAAGAALGYPLTVFVYIAARAAGVPQLAVVPSVLVIAVFAAMPGLRRHWRGSGERAPAWWSWLLGLFVVALLSWSAMDFFRRHGLSWPGNSRPYQDMVFHHVLAAEFKHHFPVQMPYVQGEPLHYHWYFHAHLAAASWGSGVDLQTLLYRLGVVPLLVMLVVLLAYGAKAVAKTWWAGPVAVFFVIFAAAPYGRIGTGWLLRTVWLSPTQTFGAAVFAALAYLVIDMLPRTPTWREWLLFALLVAGVAGAKATFVPMLLAAALLVVAVGLVTRRRLDRTALMVTGVTAAVLVAAMLLLFRGGSGGLRIDVVSFRTPGQTAAEAVIGLALGWLVAWAGVVGLVLVTHRLIDPAIVFCLGLGLAAAGVVMITTQPGGSQWYFVNSARPYLTMAAVAGLAALLTRPLARWRTVVAVALAGVMAFGVFSTLPGYGAVVGAAVKAGLRGYPRTPGQIPRGGVEAMHWLRDHSSPDDLVATNVHCLPLKTPPCDSRSFWVSAYAERRVLVEGWVYTDSAMKVAGTRRDYAMAPYWRPDVLEANDRGFVAPSSQTVGVLRDRYHVRWLVVDRRLPSDPAGLAAVADLRYDSADTAVYELRP
jgi:hypothetical protein